MPQTPERASDADGRSDAADATAATRAAADASVAARAAADAAGCVVRDLATLDELREAGALISGVWGREGETDLLPLEMLRALTSSGNFAAGAYIEGALAGAVVGFLSHHDGEVQLHSHVMGLRTGRRGRGLGFALKLHQRAWALTRGIRIVTWTFDPLVRRNAYFNLTKLGANATAYHPNFYGVLGDEINGQVVTDRLLVTWDLLSRPATLASVGRQHQASEEWEEVTPLLDVDTAGRPQVLEANGSRLRVRIPDDVLVLRRDDPPLADAWRAAMSATLGAALGDGYRAIAASRDGWYALEATE